MIITNENWENEYREEDMVYVSILQEKTRRKETIIGLTTFGALVIPTNIINIFLKKKR